MISLETTLVVQAKDDAFAMEVEVDMMRHD